MSEFFRELQAAGRSPATLRSYGMDLLRWFRFCWAIDVAWDRATRVDAREFSRWLQAAGKPVRPHWRAALVTETTVGVRSGVSYAALVRAHSETVLRGFYDFQREEGTGPVLNPFPLDRSRRDRRAHAHHNPMESVRDERTGRYRPTVPSRIPRSIPDAEFNEIFARLASHRDRALVAFYVSTGARASELLSVTNGGVDPGRQLIRVVRRTGRVQDLPASSDALVWLRLYQLELDETLPRASSAVVVDAAPSARPLTYHAAHRMFERVNGRTGTTATLHSLRHTAAYRMTEDPQVPLTDVQLVLVMPSCPRPRSITRPSRRT